MRRHPKSVAHNPARQPRSPRPSECPPHPGAPGVRCPAAGSRGHCRREFRSAQCAAIWSLRISAVIRACSLASAAARVLAASNSTRSFSNTHSIYGKSADTPPTFGTCGETDNTTPIRTTLPQGRDQACDTRCCKYLRSTGFVTSSRARRYAAFASPLRPLLRSRSALAAWNR